MHIVLPLIAKNYIFSSIFRKGKRHSSVFLKVFETEAPIIFHVIGTLSTDHSDNNERCFVLLQRS